MFQVFQFHVAAISTSIIYKQLVRQSRNIFYRCTQTHKHTLLSAFGKSILDSSFVFMYTRVRIHLMLTLQWPTKEKRTQTFVSTLVKRKSLLAFQTAL